MDQSSRFKGSPLQTQDHHSVLVNELFCLTIRPPAAPSIFYIPETPSFHKAHTYTPLLFPCFMETPHWLPFICAVWPNPDPYPKHYQNIPKLNSHLRPEPNPQNQGGNLFPWRPMEWSSSTCKSLQCGITNRNWPDTVSTK